MLVRTFASEISWIEAALIEFREAAESARAKGRDSLALCLAGGSTPESVYRAMAAAPIGGLAVDLWLGDERVVGVANPARNGSMISRAFSSCAWEPSPRLRLWPEAETPDEAIRACFSYEAELRASLGPAPSFDLALLGLGSDGHTASLFPGAPDAERGRLATLTRSPLPPHPRMTLTLGALGGARRILFIVRGSDKLPALRRLEAEDPSIPASLLAGKLAVALYLS